MPPPPRQDFPAFPFAPYPIQTEFLSFLYNALFSGPRALALLENPKLCRLPLTPSQATGTEKTPSIICSALQWLLNHRDAASRGHSERANGSAPAAVGGEEEEPDWMRDFTLQPLPPKGIFNGCKIVKWETHPYRSHGTKKVGGSEKSEGIRENDSEEKFLLDEYESDDGESTGWQAGKRAHCGGASSKEATPKVYFTSRTHSQLSRFVRELKRTNFSGKLRTVCLGSRKSLCINMDVQKLGSANRINKRCLELLKNKKSNKIKFRSEVSDHGALDIEDLAQLGRKIGTCPYGARDMVRSADLVVLFYQSLLLKSARELLGLNMKNSVVIIDEAHNLADSLTSMYNSKVESSQNVLGAGNRRYIQTLTVLTRSFLRCLISNEDCSSAVTSMTINKFLFSLDIDNINIVKLCQYLKESNIVHKIEDLGPFLCNIVTIVPKGIVIFSLPMNMKSNVNGALLLAVVGGKISEGINFSDGMGRCVLMVGLPYPSPDDMELMETIKHIGNYSTSSPSFDVLRKSGKSGREYYENLCMKAVNQSIGREIRHVNDYVAMLLVDSCYANTSSSRGFSCPVEKLPQWIRTRLTCSQNYGEVHRLLLQFFKINKQIH
ncbi:hypothetical protein VPH35_007747 [Triticum aestivum]